MNVQASMLVTINCEAQLCTALLLVLGAFDTLFSWQITCLAMKVLSLSKTKASANCDQ